MTLAQRAPSQGPAGWPLPAWSRQAASSAREAAAAASAGQGSTGSACATPTSATTRRSTDSRPNGTFTYSLVHLAILVVSAIVPVALFGIPTLALSGPLALIYVITTPR
jgi:hypothetical protein